MPAMGCNPTSNQTLGALSRAESTRKIENQGRHQDYANCGAPKHGAAKAKPSASDQER